MLFYHARLRVSTPAFFRGVIHESKKRYYDTNFYGTAIRLRLHTKHNETLQQMLGRFLREGEETAKKYTKTNQMTASKASRMISSYDQS
jgi:hypothetical protein